MCERGPDADPRDDVFEAARALSGVCELLGEAEGEVGKRTVEALLRPIADKLEPAALRVMAYKPPHFVAPEA